MNYVVLYKAPLSVRERFARATPQEAQQGVLQWTTWQERVGDALLYPGRPFGQATRITIDGAEPMDSIVVGMSILQAPDLDTALSMVRDHHHLAWSEECEIEVLEEMVIPEMAGASHPAEPG